MIDRSDALSKLLDNASEDLDFSLLEVDPEFNLGIYQKAIEHEFESLGMKVSFREKKKVVKNNIDSAFLKSETLWRELLLQGIIPQQGINQLANIKIKIEVDTEPPLVLKQKKNYSYVLFHFM